MGVGPYGCPWVLDMSGGRCMTLWCVGPYGCGALWYRPMLDMLVATVGPYGCGALWV